LTLKFWAEPYQRPRLTNTKVLIDLWLRVG
jgi:hypothetical protein